LRPEASKCRRNRGNSTVLLGWIDDTARFTFVPNLVTQANRATFRFCNPSSSTVSHPALNYTVIALRF
jgi:hypothetical protein